MQLARPTPPIAGVLPSRLPGAIPGSGHNIEGALDEPCEPTLIRTKIQIPAACGEAIGRDRLEKLTKEITRRLLTLVTAPPGCGKTTLARQWAEQLLRQGARVAWFSIDEEDDDPQRFLRCLCLATASTGFSRVVPGARSGRSNTMRTPEAMWSALLNEVMEFRDELVIVLDNYSCIKDRRIHDQIFRAMENAPSNLHFVVLASAPPPFPIGRLRARDQLLELNAAQIRFDRAETLDFLRESGAANIQPNQLQEVYRYTQGWPAAVRIMSKTIGKSGRPSRSDRGVLDSQAVAAVGEYLDDLGASLPMDLIETMIDTSMMDVVSPELYRVLADGHSTDAFFCQLEQLQILVPIDPDNELFAYPAPVRHHLRTRLAAKGRHHVSGLHRRASEWFAQQSRWDEAIDHALDAGDTETALRWLDCHAMSLLKAGHLASLLRWHQRSPAFRIAVPLRVRFAFAWAHAITHSLPAALELVEAIVAGADAAPGSAMRAECDAILAVAHASADQIERTTNYTARCLNYPFTDSWIGSVVANIDLYCRFRTGRWAALFAEPTDRKILGEGETNTQVLRLSILGLAGLLRGPLDQAERYANEAIRLSPAARERDVLHFAAWPAGLLATVYYETGRFDELKALLDDRLAEIVTSGYLDCTMGAYLAAARAAARLGKPAEALSILDQGERIAVDRQWPRFEASILLERLHLHLCEDRLAEAEGCLQRLAQLPRGNGIDDATPICTVAQSLELALAYLAIRCGKTAEAIASLKALLEQFSNSGNELFAVRVGTLLSTAHRQAGDHRSADALFLETVARAEKGGFVSAVVDQGPEVGHLLSALCTELENSQRGGRLIKYASRLLDEWRQAADARHGQSKNTTGPERKDGSLTPKEREVLSLMARGQSNKEIARSLQVTPETIKTHLKRIFIKLSVDRRIHAIAKAKSMGLLSH